MITTDDIFNSMFNMNQTYQLPNASDEQILLYKNAFKIFKEKNPDTTASIKLNMETSNIELINFNAIDMYRFGYNVAKLEK